MKSLAPELQVFLLALLLDLVIGDPRWLLHPTQVMGLGITALEKKLRPWAVTVRRQYWAGLIIEAIIVGLSWAVTKVLIVLVRGWSPLLTVVLSAWLLSTTIAARGLAGAAWEIASALQKGDLAAARRQVALIVGRDTEKMDESEIARATVESVAENTSDAVIAPLFYSLIGGVPLAMAYRAINTLDSMLGYKNERYLYFGRVAARVDDWANFIPARVTAILLCLAAFFWNGRGWEAWRIVRRYGRRHPSPNSGYPEAAMAGALGVRLGGLNFYQGIPEERPIIGEGERSLRAQHITRAVGLMLTALFLFAGCSGGIMWLLSRQVKVLGDVYYW
ncbi:MAG: adenosylcobinamide-phosphate synthase CbiB [Moorellaceae bacterium]